MSPPSPGSGKECCFPRACKASILGQTNICLVRRDEFSPAHRLFSPHVPALGVFHPAGVDGSHQVDEAAAGCAAGVGAGAKRHAGLSICHGPTGGQLSRVRKQGIQYSSPKRGANMWFEFRTGGSHNTEALFKKKKSK